MSRLTETIDSIVESVEDFVDIVIDAVGDVIEGVADAFLDLFGLDDLLEDYEGILATKRGNVASLPVVYGNRTIGGNWIHMVETGADNKYLWLVYALADADSPINAITNIYLDDILYTDAKYSGHVSVETTVGGHTTQPFTALQAAASTWTADHRLLGVAAVALKLTWNQDIYRGLPKLGFELQGSEVLDISVLPTETRIYSINPAEVLFDYLTNPIYGKGLSIVDGVDLDIQSFLDAKTYCNDSITSYSGGPSHTRMECHLVLPSGRQLMQNIKAILKSCRGTLPYINGKFYLVIERHYTPADYGLTNYFDFNIDNIIGRWGFKSGDVSTRYNRVKATFPNEAIGHKSDFVVVESAAFRAADGRLLERTVSLPSTTNVYRAIDTASIILRKSRQQISVSFTALPEALKVRAGTIVTVTHPTPGWTLKQFRVSKIRLLKTGNCAVTLTEHEETIYDLSVPNEVVTPPDTNLPDPSFVPDITGLTPTSDETVLKIEEDGTLVARLHLTWDIPSNVFVNGYDVEIKLSSDSLWLPAGSPNSIGSNEIYIPNLTEGGIYDYRVRAHNSGGFNGAWNTATNYTIIGKTSDPNDVTSLSHTIAKQGVTLTWPANSDLDIFDYEIRTGGADWASASFVAFIAATELSVGVLSTGTTVYRVKARDTGKRASANAVTTSVIVSNPAAPVVSSEIKDKAVVLTWTVPTGTFAIAGYNISYTHPVNGLVSLGRADANTLTFEVDWGGSATFHVSAIDLAGNTGAEGDEVVVISSPVAGIVSANVIDNNVLLNWPEMANTLPIEKYELRKGATYGASTFIAFQTGTYAFQFETAAADYTYWVTGVDTAGNFGVNNSVTASVSAPPDYVLLSDQNIDLTTGVYTNVFANQNNWLNFGVNLTETWADHFNVNNSFAHIQDQIDAGYPHYIQPTFHYSDTVTDITSKQCTVTSTTGLSTGFKVRLAGLAVTAEEGIYNVASVDDATHFTVTEAITNEASAAIPVKAGSKYETLAIDYGTILSNLSITANVTGAVLDGNPGVFVKISISDDDISYTDFAYSQNKVFAESFRYVKIAIEVTGDSGDDLYEVSLLNVVVDVKELTESGTVDVTSATLGAPVTFLKTWIDVTSINVSPVIPGAGSSDDYNAIADFTDIPNPTGMEVRLFKSGTQQSSGKVGWIIRGH